jgi:peptide/nickel transport system permease protein
MTVTLDRPSAAVLGDDEVSTGPQGIHRVTAVLLRLGRVLGVLIPVVFVASFVTFLLGAVTNSSPATIILGDGANTASVAKLNRTMGFDRPLVVQYWHWISHAIEGNLGRSYFSDIPVVHSIAQRLPVDLSIAGLALFLSLIIGGTAGILAGTHRGSWIDRLITAVCSVASTLPAFLVGIILVVLFATTIKLFPGNGYVGPTTSITQWLRHITLPGLALAVEVAVPIARQLRTSLVRVLDENYIVGAEVRGLSRRRVLLRHALRNASAPTITVIGYAFPQMIAGAVAAEAIFSLPGIGQLALQSAQQRDIPVVQGVLLVTSSMVIVANLLVNAILAWLNPAQGR